MTTETNPTHETEPTPKPNGVKASILQSPPDFEAMFPVRRYLGDDGSPAIEPGLDPALMKRMMRFMIWNRELDERLTKLQRQGRIGFHIGSVGEEALMIGSAAAAKPSDWVVPCYREAGVALYRGFPVEKLVANMYGTGEDPVLGRQMPCHYSAREQNFVSISSPVGTQITQAAGVAWAAKLRKTGDVVVVYFGDGATSQGDFHTGLNFAGVYKVPVVFICRNNQWAISTPFEVQTAAKTVAQKSVAYGIAGERVDGNDVLASYTATRDAIERARRGEGPTLLEMYTYRQGAHSTSDDPRAYRQQDEVDQWIKKDPLARFRRYLEPRGLWSEAEDQAARTEIGDLLAKAIERAEKAPRPPLGSLFQDVFKDQTAQLAEQQAELEEAIAQGYVPAMH
ncbi:pyruvate dehydrogenase (acetyl-transferring) E1 component subunit alpha [Myxococcota bacterium]|nr:pyruvate dehydrogenase (acetyl-transferring) E1 component subunit alpha [Myxococcota bacterium]